MSTVLVNAIAEALVARWRDTGAEHLQVRAIDDAAAAADACIAVVAAMPADYTGTDILAFLRGEDVPSEPLPAKDDEGDVLLAAIITHAAEALRVADTPDGAA